MLLSRPLLAREAGLSRLDHAVLHRGHLSGIGVRSLGRQEVGLDPFRHRARMRIGVNRDEEIGTLLCSAKLVRSRSGTKTSVLRVSATLIARSSSTIRATRLVTSRTTSFSREATRSGGAGIVAAMPGVEHDQADAARSPAGRRGRPVLPAGGRRPGPAGRDRAGRRP